MSEGAQVLGGRYEVLRELARGGMGRVLLARDRLLDRQLAVKTILAGDDASARLRFVREAQITGRLDHPGIVPVHELGREGRELFLALKLVRGRELKSLLEEVKAKKETAASYGLNRLLRLFLKVCEAMACAHEQRIVHRDLKPANVMIEGDDAVLVMDWGLAKDLTRPEESLRSTANEPVSGSGELTQEGAVVGTPIYMPPEQADGVKDLDLRADVYALGAILYQLLTLRAPYSGGATQVLAALFRGPPPLPHVAAPERGIPEALESITLKAMSREREGRYASAAELADDVRAYLDGDAVRAHDESPIAALLRVLRRRRAVIGTALVALLVLVAVGGVAWLSVGSAKAKAAALEEEARGQQRRARRELAVADAAKALSKAAASVARAVGDASVFAHRDTRRALPLAQLELRHREVTGAISSLALPPANGVGEAELRESLITALATARREENLAFARALVARAPQRFLRARHELDLGGQGPLLRARALTRLRRWSEAKRILAAGAWPADSACALAANALKLRLEGAPLASQREALDRALSAARRAGESTSWLHLRRAECAAQQGELDAAEADYRRARFMDPLDMYALLSRYRHLVPGTYEIEFPMAVLRAGHEIAPALKPELRLAYWITRVWQGERQYLERVEKLASNAAAKGGLPRADANARVAQAALRARASEKAIEFARRALQERPGWPQALALLAEAQLQQGDLEEAERVAQGTLARAPQDPRLNLVLGEAAARRGETAEAAKRLRLAARGSLDPGRWLRLAQVLSRSSRPQDWARGVEAARRGLSLDPIAELYGQGLTTLPGDPRHHRVLGVLRRRQGKLGAAALHFTRAWFQSRLKKQDERDALAAAEVHAELGLRAEALLLCEEAGARDARVRDDATALAERIRAGG